MLSMENILVVDDEQDVGLLMKAMLTSAGYQVLYASNLEDARNLLKQNPVRLVFLDLNLDNEYGLNLLPSVNETQKNADIVVITAKKDPDLKKTVIEKGVKQLIEKPFSKKEIFSALRSCA